MFVQIESTAINRCFCELDLHAAIEVVGGFIRVWLNEEQLAKLRFSGIYFAEVSSNAFVS